MDNLGIVLLNMGGPTSLDSVQPFLENLFLDKEIISFGPVEFARTPLAKYIAKRRAKSVRENYALIGGKSPIAELSRRQADALQTRLCAAYGDTVRVRVELGFSYWHPFIADAMDALEQDGYTRVFLLPLYPQYSKSTTGSCFKTWRNLHRERGNRRFSVQSVKAYPTAASYVAAINRRIDEALLQFPEERRDHVHLLFSAHGTPVKLVEEGDPYSHQIVNTMNAVLSARSYALPHHLSYQSKVGPARWLEPDTVDKTKELAAAGVRDLLVVPIAFVTDHVETLHELNIELRHVANAAGIENFTVMQGLNDDENFIEALATIVLDRMARRAAMGDFAQ